MVPFGRKMSWKKRQVARCEARAIKELEKGMKEAAQKEKEVGMLSEMLVCVDGLGVCLRSGEEKKDCRETAEEDRK